MNYKEEAYLLHYGVLGMKWGRRKARPSAGEISRNIRDYRKKYNAASSNADKADALVREAKEAYRKTGKTGLGRLVNNIRGKSPEVREYSKKYNKAMDAKDKSDTEWREAKAAYKNTGRNALSRVVNNVKYDAVKSKVGAKEKANVESKIKKLDGKKKKSPSWLKKQANEWKKAFEEVEKENAEAEANKDWGDHLVDSIRANRRRKRIRKAWNLD